MVRGSTPRRGAIVSWMSGLNQQFAKLSLCENSAVGSNPTLTATNIKNMECIYINLNNRTDRRDLLESNFNSVKLENWTLTRFSARDVNFVKTSNTKGSIRDVEKACFLSHRDAINSAKYDDHLMIVEDDVSFGTKTCEEVEKLLAKNVDTPWDIMYTDVCVPEVSTMLKLFKAREAVLEDPKSNSMVLANLNQFNYAGATCYIINKKSKARINTLLSKYKFLDLPIDLVYREWVKNAKIAAFTIFPFVTSFNETAFNSDLRLEHENGSELAWLLFRKLMYLERDLEADSILYNQLVDSVATKESTAFGKILSAMTSPNYVAK